MPLQLEMEPQRRIYPAARHQIRLPFAEFADGNRIAPVAQVAAIHAQLPPLRPVSNAGAHGSKATHERHVLLIEEAATRVVHLNPAQESFGGLVEERHSREIVR